MSTYLFIFLRVCKLVFSCYLFLCYPYVRQNNKFDFDFDFTIGAILRRAQSRGTTLRLFCFKKSSSLYTRRITPKRVTSGEAHLRELMPRATVAQLERNVNLTG